MCEMVVLDPTGRVDMQTKLLSHILSHWTYYVISLFPFTSTAYATCSLLPDWQAGRTPAIRAPEQIFDSPGGSALSSLCVPPSWIHCDLTVYEWERQAVTGDQEGDFRRKVDESLPTVLQMTYKDQCTFGHLA